MLSLTQASIARARLLACIAPAANFQKGIQTQGEDIEDVTENRKWVATLIDGLVNLTCLTEGTDAHDWIVDVLGMLTWAYASSKTSTVNFASHPFPPDCNSIEGQGRSDDTRVFEAAAHRVSALPIEKQKFFFSIVPQLEDVCSCTNVGEYSMNASQSWHDI